MHERQQGQRHFVTNQPIFVTNRPWPEKRGDFFLKFIRSRGGWPFRHRLLPRTTDLLTAGTDIPSLRVNVDREPQFPCRPETKKPPHDGGYGNRACLVVKKTSRP